MLSYFGSRERKGGLVDNIVENQKFENTEEEISPDLINRLVEWVEREIYYPKAKRLNFLLRRVNDNIVEITPEGNEVNEDGNWRFFIDSNGDLIIQKRVSGVWTNYLLQKGDAQGQMLFWEHDVKWAKTEVGELFYDDINKFFGVRNSSPTSELDVGGTATVTRLLAGGVNES